VEKMTNMAEIKKPSKKQLSLVTGACGFVGSNLTKRLIKDGNEVIATDLPQAFEHPKIKSIAKSIGLDLSHDKCQVIPADLRNKDSLRRLFEYPISHIYHTASLYDYSAPMTLLNKINVDGSVNLFELAAKSGDLKHFIHWSTCGVFGKPYTPKEGNKCNLPFNEEVCPSPKNTPFGQDGPTGTHLVNNYSITKWKQEQIAWRFYNEEGLPLTVVRPAPIYGPGSDYGHGGIALAINRGYLPIIPADAKNYITASVHVEDIVGFPIYIADKDFSIGEDYNVIDDSIISYYEFLHYLALLLGRKIYDLPFISLKFVQPVMIRWADLWCRLEEKYNIPRIRVFEASSATYLSSSYLISNKKSKEAGYIYHYPDVRIGMRDTIDWFRQSGWLDKSYNPKAAWKEYMET
jgi:dihydroflavonol-4-reductase